MKGVGIHPEYVELEIDDAHVNFTASCLWQRHSNRLCPPEGRMGAGMPARVRLVTQGFSQRLSVELCWDFCTHYPARHRACLLAPMATDNLECDSVDIYYLFLMAILSRRSI